MTQRIHDYLVAALSQMLIGDPAPDSVGLARLACEVGDASAHADVARSVLGLLDSIEGYVASTNYTPPEPGAPRLPYPATGILVVAANVAMTPHVPVP